MYCFERLELSATYSLMALMRLEISSENSFYAANIRGDNSLQLFILSKRFGWICGSVLLYVKLPWNFPLRFESSARSMLFATMATLSVSIVSGVTTSRATSGDRKNDPNTSGQRWNNFHTSYIDRSFVVSGNNRVVKPKCKQFTSLNKMLSNSKVLIVHISFTALINNEGIGGIRKVPRRIKCTFCSCRK